MKLDFINFTQNPIGKYGPDLLIVQDALKQKKTTSKVVYFSCL